ncbi:MAG: hypothetical protein EHM28_08835 [Spirochaetaceae bacterium]|nr:MAG: hypothetical protein EHM28_08835 [Spirochaetaceae bacterium]
MIITCPVSRTNENHGLLIVTRTISFFVIIFCLAVLTCACAGSQISSAADPTYDKVVDRL